MPTFDSYDLARWRGTVDERLDNQDDQVSALWKWRDAHEIDAAAAKKEIFNRLTILEVKMVGMCALAGFVGTAGALVGQWMIKRAIGL